MDWYKVEALIVALGHDICQTTVKTADQAMVLFAIGFMSSVELRMQIIHGCFSLSL